VAKITHAIILAGGKGERMRPLTSDRPKPMVYIGGKPIIAYPISQVVKAGVNQIVFACSYKREVLINHIKTGKRYGVKAIYSIEESPLGRGGGIKQAMKQLEGDWEDVIVTNGDQIWQLDLPAMIEKHQAAKALATIVVVPLKSPYGIVEVNDHDQVLGFKEKPLLPHWVNAGIYIFNREIMDLLPDVGDHEDQTFPKLPKERFIVYKSHDYWRGVDTVKDKTEADAEVGKIFK